ncbi:hypothetical protein BH23VER1_BH23VER1_11920 [soil metagenome]
MPPAPSEIRNPSARSRRGRVTKVVASWPSITTRMGSPRSRASTRFWMCGRSGADGRTAARTSGGLWGGACCGVGGTGAAGLGDACVVSARNSRSSPARRRNKRRTARTSSASRTAAGWGRRCMEENASLDPPPVQSLQETPEQCLRGEFLLVRAAPFRAGPLSTANPGRCQALPWAGLGPPLWGLEAWVRSNGALPILRPLPLYAKNPRQKPR